MTSPAPQHAGRRVGESPTPTRSPVPGDVNVGSSQQQGDEEGRDEDSQCHVSPFQRRLGCRFCY